MERSLTEAEYRRYRRIEDATHQLISCGDANVVALAQWTGMKDDTYEAMKLAEAEWRQAVEEAQTALNGGSSDA